MYEEEPTDLVDDIIRPHPKPGDVIEQCAIHQTHILIEFGKGPSSLPALQTSQ